MALRKDKVDKVIDLIGEIYDIDFWEDHIRIWLDRKDIVLTKDNVIIWDSEEGNDGLLFSYEELILLKEVRDIYWNNKENEELEK